MFSHLMMPDTLSNSSAIRYLTQKCHHAYSLTLLACLSLPSPLALNSGPEPSLPFSRCQLPRAAVIELDPF